MKELVTEFYVNKFNFYKNSEEFDLSFVPAILRRRISLLDKYVLSAMNSTYSDDVEDIVLSSQFGEFERLIKIIGQYTENQEVSPNTFSGSVHNFAVGFFLLNKRKTIPYTALSACEKSLSFGLLSAVISKYDNTLFCYADANKGINNSLAVNLSKTKKENSVKYILKYEKHKDTNSVFGDFADFFSRKSKQLITSDYSIERVD
ncbi:MAG: beta-ketoacyl synthase chain length factor [Candidatus Gastranaerophilales bacterium]|nr:beta-ketoacyl synthase chain length factor [Candidatus Gastranaerophilales bacterium]